MRSVDTAICNDLELPAPLTRWFQGRVSFQRRILKSVHLDT